MWTLVVDGRTIRIHYKEKNASSRLFQAFHNDSI